MNCKEELLKILQKHNLTIEQAAKMTNTHPQKLQKRFDEEKILYLDAQKILDVLGYEFKLKKR